jgi:hypothetical protein
MRLTLIVLAALSLAACSKADQHKTTDDIKTAASDLKGTVKEGTNSVYGASLKEDAKDLAKDTGKAVKEGAKETKSALDKQTAKQRKG